MRAFLVFVAVLLIAAVMRRHHEGGFSPTAVHAHYLGEVGDEPLAPAALWEEAHTNAFLYGFLLLALGSLLVVCPVRPGLRRAFLGMGALAALFDTLAPFAIVSLRAGASLRVASFVIALAALAAMTVVAAARFGRAASISDEVG